MMTDQFPPLPETVQQQVLPNGLTVIGIQKPGFVRHYAQLTVFFGSASTRTVTASDGTTVTLPAGMAHFLEHKMFDKGTYDAADLFAARGADVNAYTTRDITNYYCSGLQNIQADVQDLINFVLTPYFTQETVEREQGIIAQEIQMYQDEPDYASQQVLWEHLFPDSIIAEDVAGTRASIVQITPAILRAAYDTYYQAHNMQLVVIGDFDFTQLIDQLTFPAVATPKRAVPAAPVVQENVKTAPRLMRAPSSLPEAWLGVRLPAMPDPIQRMRMSLLLDILLSGLLLESAPDFLRLYQDGWIDDSFLVDAELHSQFGVLTVGGKTPVPVSLLHTLTHILTVEHARQAITPTAFAHLQKELIGRTITGFDHYGWLAQQMIDTADLREGDRHSIYSVNGLANMVASLNRAELLTLAEQLLQPSKMSAVLVSPEEGEHE